MPLVRVDLARETFEAKHQQISAAIHEAQVEVLGVPPDDLFQVFNPHGPDELVFSPSYNGVDRTDLVLVQMTAVHMHGAEAKTALFRAMAAKLAAIGIPESNLLVSWIENCFGDWYAGKS